MNWDYNKGNLSPPGRSLPLGAACDMIQILDPARCSSPLLPAAERTQRDIHTYRQTDTCTWCRNKHRAWIRTLAVTVQYLLMLNTVLYLSTHLVAFKVISRTHQAGRCQTDDCSPRLALRRLSCPGTED